MVRRNLVATSSRRQEQFNKTHRLIKYQLGDLVKIKKANKSNAGKKVTKKFALLYEGPYVIVAVPFANVYTLMDPNTKLIRGKFNTINLARYHT